MKPRQITALAGWIAIPPAIVWVLFQFELGLMAVCFYSLFLLLATSRLQPLLWLKPIQSSREVDRDVVEIGDWVKVTVKLKNLAPWPVLWLYATETLPKKMPTDGTTKRLTFIPPRRSFHLTYAINFTRRGCHQIGPVVLESGDVFGLFKSTRVERRRDFVTVLPSHHVIEEFQVGQHRRLGDIDAARSIFEDPTRIRGVREYRRGDPMKRIHWKASARTGELVSKIYDPVLEAGATIILDFNAQAWSAARATDATRPPPEMAVEIVCTICRYLTDGGWKTGFFSNGRDPLGLPGISMAQACSTDSLSEALDAARVGWSDDRLAPISIRASASSEQFPLIHENLGRIELSDGLSIEALMLEELAYIERTQALVIVTGQASESFITGVLRARELGYRIMVFVVCCVEAHDRAFEAFTGVGIEVFRMDEDWRLKEIATGRRSF